MFYVKYKDIFRAFSNNIFESLIICNDIDIIWRFPSLNELTLIVFKYGMNSFRLGGFHSFNQSVVYNKSIDVKNTSYVLMCNQPNFGFINKGFHSKIISAKLQIINGHTQPIQDLDNRS